jgi:hypothetical protein
VLVNTRVIAGDEANDSLQFGRGLILGKSKLAGFALHHRSRARSPLA